MVMAASGRGGLLTGIKDLDREMSGGIRTGSLVLIEGPNSAGKSVLSQHVVYNALSSGENAVAYYSVGHDARGMLTQMKSLAMPTMHYFLADRLRVYPLNRRQDSKTRRVSYRRLSLHLMRLPERFNLVVLDSITGFLNNSSPMATMNFFWMCKKLCEQNRSVILVVDSHAFDAKVLARVSSLCEYYFKLKPEMLSFQEDQIDGTLVKLLEIVRMHGADCAAKGRVYFEVTPGEGIHTIPYAQFKV